MGEVLGELTKGLALGGAIPPLSNMWEDMGEKGAALRENGEAERPVEVKGEKGEGDLTGGTGAEEELAAPGAGGLEEKADLVR